MAQTRKQEILTRLENSYRQIQRIASVIHTEPVNSCPDTMNVLEEVYSAQVILSRLANELEDKKKMGVLKLVA